MVRLKCARLWNCPINGFNKESLNVNEIANAHVAVEKIVRNEWGRVLAALIKQFRDFDQAEDALQDALLAALSSWPQKGLPNSPAAWLLATAKRKAIDRFRRMKTINDKQSELQALCDIEAQPNEDVIIDEIDTVIDDDRLRLIFTCCHPALSEQDRVALTLKSITGMATSEIARAFLLGEETMAQRLVRAKRKIKATNIPYQIPSPEQLDERLHSVLTVIYLIFNEGYSATRGEDLIRKDLCNEAIRLTELLLVLMKEEREVHGLLSLLLLHSSRLQARCAINGQLITLEQQDRTLWDRDLIKRGLTILITTLTSSKKGKMGAYQIQAAISAAHTAAATYEQTNWREISMLYEKLYKYQPTPVIMLNGAVALSFAHGPAAGLAAIQQIDDDNSLAHYQPFYAAKADMLRRLGRINEAMKYYRQAVELSSNSSEKQYLRARLDRLEETLVKDKPAPDSN